MSPLRKIKGQKKKNDFKFMTKRKESVEAQDAVQSAEEDITARDGTTTESGPQPPEPVQLGSEVSKWVQQMNQVPLTNVKGAGSTQENRCTPGEIDAVVAATVSLFGIHESTALTAISEMVRRGGANASTPDSFNVELKCPVHNVAAIISKREIAQLVSRLANGKNMRNLAEGMAEAIVVFGVDLVRKQPSVDRPGDLAKKVDNRLSYEKQPPLTPAERVGCASYAQWLPHLDQLVGSDRLKSLLARDLELRKQGRVLPQPKQKVNTDKSPQGEKKKKGGKEKKKKM